MPQLTQIPAGTVRIDDARRGTSREVTLAAFEIDVHPVTVAEYDIPATRSSRAVHEAPHGDAPAAGVRWIDAVRWCNVASLVAGHSPAYTIADSHVAWDLNSNGFRLPTEAEWVYASRAGTEGARYGELTEIAWTSNDDVTGPQPVGQKHPNAFGLTDTLGNVWEWCWDRLDPARYGDYRVLKGGGWADPEWSCRVGVRRGDAPDAHLEDAGFRLARGAPGPTGQGWSEAQDRSRADIAGPRPIGWTPLDRVLPNRDN